MMLMQHFMTNPVRKPPINIPGIAIILIKLLGPPIFLTSSTEFLSSSENLERYVDIFPCCLLFHLYSVLSPEI